MLGLKLNCVSKRGPWYILLHTAQMPCLEGSDQLWWHLRNMVVHLAFPVGIITPEYCMGVIGLYFAGDISLWNHLYWIHYNDFIMSAMASQINSLTIVYSTVYSGVDQRKHQSSASLAFVRGIHWWPVNSPHEGPITRKMFSFDAVIIVG